MWPASLWRLRRSTIIFKASLPPFDDDPRTACQPLLSATPAMSSPSRLLLIISDGLKSR
jgi:hypothetical protein